MQACTCSGVWGVLHALDKSSVGKSTISVGKSTMLAGKLFLIFCILGTQDDARPLLNTLGPKTIQDLIDTEINTMVFKVLNGLAQEYLSDLFIRNSESHLWALRNTNTGLQVPKKTTNNGQECFSYRGAKLWNALPLEIKPASSLLLFKTKLKYSFFFISSYIFYYIVSYFCISVYFQRLYV